VMSIPGPPCFNFAELKVTPVTSRLSMFCPVPPGKLFGASPVKSATCGPGHELPAGRGGGGAGAEQSLTSARPVFAEIPVHCRV